MLITSAPFFCLVNYAAMLGLSCCPYMSHCICTIPVLVIVLAKVHNHTDSQHMHVPVTTTMHHPSDTMQMLVQHGRHMQHVVHIFTARPACMHTDPESSQEYDICQAGVARTSLHVGDTKQGRSIALSSNSPQLCKECAQILEAQEKLPVHCCSSFPPMCPSCHACTCSV